MKKGGGVIKTDPLNYQDMERERTCALFKGKCDGIIRGIPRKFALKNWTQSLWSEIKDDSITYFRENKIGWHIYARQGHILSSQICCVNHLFPIRHDKENVLRLAKMVCNEFVDVLPITTDKYSPAFIQFEAVTDIDHLNEGNPTRGSNCTSVDALIYAVHKNGSRYLIPIEWKYTEKYENEDKSIEDRPVGPKGNELRGKERLKRYSKLIDKSKNLKKYPKYRNSIYFFEPFYQLMRQTLWAEQMILHKNKERLKADDYIHLHIIPDENDELLYRKYKKSRKPLRESWQDNLKNKGKYVIISPMDFLRNIDNTQYGELLKYLRDRYWGGKLAYIEKRYWKKANISNSKYISGCFDEFDNLSGTGMDIGNLCSKLNEPCQYGGPQGLFAPKILESNNEEVLMVDYAFLRNATAYAVFINKETKKITRKMPYTVFMKIYDSLLDSGYSETGIFKLNVFENK